MNGRLADCVNGKLGVSRPVLAVCKALAHGLAITDKLRITVISFTINSGEISVHFHLKPGCLLSLSSLSDLDEIQKFVYALLSRFNIKDLTDVLRF